MIKHSIIAAGAVAVAVAAAVFAFQPQQAKAETRLNFQLNPSGATDENYGDPYSGPIYYGEPTDTSGRHDRIGCHQARHMLRQAGFQQVRVRNCHGKRYTFKARRDGDWWILKVSARTGRILRARPI